MRDAVPYDVKGKKKNKTIENRQKEAEVGGQTSSGV